MEGIPWWNGGRGGVIPLPKRAVNFDLSVNVFNILIATHGGLVAVQLSLLLHIEYRRNWWHQYSKSNNFCNWVKIFLQGCAKLKPCFLCIQFFLVACFHQISSTKWLTYLASVSNPMVMTYVCWALTICNAHMLTIAICEGHKVKKGSSYIVSGLVLCVQPHRVQLQFMLISMPMIYLVLSPLQL